MNTYEWYKKLKKPDWAPETKVFGIVWGFLYPIIIVSYGYVFYHAFKGNISWYTTLPFVFNLFVNLIFTPIQFGLKNNELAFIDILLTWGSIIWVIFSIWQIYPAVAILQAPYLVWVSIATVLQFEVTRLNRHM